MGVNPDPRGRTAQRAGSPGSIIYQALCDLLAERPRRIAWDAFTPFDVVALVRMARLQGVAPLVYWRLGYLLKDRQLSSHVAGTIAGIHSQLAQDYYHCSAHNQMLYHELEGILSALRQAQIRVALLKGAALAGTLYEDISLRPMNDIDLLVPRHDLERAVEAVNRLGYHVVLPPHLGMAGWVDEAANHHAHMEGGLQNRMVIELHWNLVAGDADWRAPALDWFWQGVQTISLPKIALEGGQAPTQLPAQASCLSPAANLLYCAAHLLLQHGGYRSILLWYYDLHLLVEAYGQSMHWSELAEQAGKLSWADALSQGLQAAQARFGTRLPDGVLELLAPYSDPRARRVIELNARLQDEPLRDTWQGLQVYERRTRIRMMLALVFPSPDYLRWRYRPAPAWLWPLCYPYRWLSIAWIGLNAVLKKATVSAR